MPGDDLYESGGDGAPAMGGDMPKGDDQEPKGDEGGETALVPTSLCPGMKPGEEMVVKINRVVGDQYEVSYAPEKKGEGEEGAGGEGGAPPAEMPGGMASTGGRGMYD